MEKSAKRYFGKNETLFLRCEAGSGEGISERNQEGAGQESDRSREAIRAGIGRKNRIEICMGLV